MAKKANKTAKAKAKAKDAEQQPAGEQPQEKILATISKRKLDNLLRVCRTGGKDIASINGTIREEIGNAKRNDHLHTGAFAMIRKLDKLEPQELANFMDYFDHYYDVSGLHARAESAPRMQFGPGEQTGGEEGDEEGEVNEPPTRDAKLRQAFPAPATVSGD
jgi:hypothetical protein